MRQVVYGAACSLDGFLAGPDGSLDWIHFSKDVERLIAAQWTRFDVVLMGRKTWLVGLEMGGAATMPGAATYVFSRTLADQDAPGATLVRDDAVEFVRALKQAPGKDICLMGGGELAQSLFAAGLIDEVGLNIHPVILGAGAPFFRDPGHRIPMTLVDTETLDGGCIMATYRVSTSPSGGE